jgi:DNA-binding MarR family transcriptional regulator
MEYIKEILGVEVERSLFPQVGKLPYFLTNDYRFETVRIDGTQCLFLQPVGELATINMIKKHLKRLREVCDCPPVFELETITQQRRKSFIAARIAFAVPGKHIYLPFIGVQLQDRCDSKTAITPVLKKLQPSAQMLLFAFILRKNKAMYLSEMTKQFSFSAMTISRAASQLVQMQLISKSNDGVQKVLTADITPEELFRKAAPYLINPVRKVVYINRLELNHKMFHAGLSALADMSMLNPPVPETWGTAESAGNLTGVNVHLIDTDTQCALELWKYDPRLISGNGQIDALSLATSLSGEKDERVEQTLQDTLQKVWYK